MTIGSFYSLDGLIYKLRSFDAIGVFTPCDEFGNEIMTMNIKGEKCPTTALISNRLNEMVEVLISGNKQLTIFD